MATWALGALLALGLLAARWGGAAGAARSASAHRFEAKASLVGMIGKDR